MDNKKTDTGNVKLSVKVSDFLQKHRKLLGVCFGIVAAGILTFIIVFIASENMLEKTWSRVEEFVSRYEKLKATDTASSGSWVASEIFEEGPGNSLTGAAVEAVPVSPEMAKLREDIYDFASSASGFPAARSYSIIASIYEDEKNWAESEAAWVRAAKSAAKTYFAPVSWFRAAIAAEEQGNSSVAIGYYTEALKSSDIFPAAPRARFSIGRLMEGQGDIAGALGSYKSLVESWPSDPFWHKLAQSRILALDEQ